MTAAHVKADVATLADPARAEFLQRFFRTGKGEYAEGDLLLGLRVPQQRVLAKRFAALPLAETKKLLRSKFHEHRLIALLILCAQYERGDAEKREALHRLYREHTAYVNNWDLVDTSARILVGEHLPSENCRLLDRLAASDLLWERRIAMIATLAYIRKGELAPTFRIARKLLGDRHDLIHKAVGWMLREAGKQSPAELLEFLKANYAKMPRTALRYAIEHFPEARRKQLLRGEFR
ncbi:DNA alkylation repair protein [Terriglobus tenax]|uniref:DNA alkylation repair protein n=1 Tax=Terriglobus tenax TaxID=1111115 RepID=UPI0021E02AA3|nr:DNA alkylation repair protein [Terriglobus tenax]